MEQTDDRRWLLKRPTFIDWHEITYTTIRPVLGQGIRIRESVQVFFERSAFTRESMLWLNRYTAEQFIGHFQVFRNTQDIPDSPKLITEHGQMIGFSNNDEFSKWQFQREYTLNYHLLRDDASPAVNAAIENCNADLAPGPVENRNIQPATVNNYAQLAYGLATGNLVNFNELLTKLASPVINGFKFPESVLFRSKTEIPTVTLEGLRVGTQLGDVGMWVHPDWMVNPEANYSFQVINYAVLPATQTQYPFVDTCTYPGGNLDFP
jgi:hypothetical protein